MDLTAAQADTDTILDEHGETFWVNRKTISWSGGKGTEIWASNGSITGDYQSLRGKTLSEEQGLEKKSTGRIFTKHDADVLEGDQISLPEGKKGMVNRVKDYGDHKVVFVREVEGAA